MLQKVRKYIRFFLWIAAIFTCNFFSSCKDEDCVSILNNDLLVNLLHTDTLENGNIIFEKLDTMFYEVKAAENDSIFYSVDQTVSKLVLPVNPAKDMTIFEFYMIDSVRTDTLSTNPINIQKTYYRNPVPHILSVSYLRITRVISEDCGIEIGYARINVDETTFDSVNVVKNRLSRLNDVNIEVFF
jgi:hypothetical protein